MAWRLVSRSALRRASRSTSDTVPMRTASGPGLARRGADHRPNARTDACHPGAVSDSRRRRTDARATCRLKRSCRCCGPGDLWSLRDRSGLASCHAYHRGSSEAGCLTEAPTGDRAHLGRSPRLWHDSSRTGADADAGMWALEVLERELG